MTIDPVTGDVAWTGAGSNGDYVVGVSDGPNPVVSQSIAVTVRVPPRTRMDKGGCALMCV